MADTPVNTDPIYTPPSNPDPVIPPPTLVSPESQSGWAVPDAAPPLTVNASSPSDSQSNTAADGTITAADSSPFSDAAYSIRRMLTPLIGPSKSQVLREGATTYDSQGNVTGKTFQPDGSQIDQAGFLSVLTAPTRQIVPQARALAADLGAAAGGDTSFKNEMTLDAQNPQDASYGQNLPEDKRVAAQSGIPGFLSRTATEVLPNLAVQMVAAHGLGGAAGALEGGADLDAALASAQNPSTISHAIATGVAFGQQPDGSVDPKQAAIMAILPAVGDAGADAVKNWINKPLAGSVNVNALGPGATRIWRAFDATPRVNSDLAAKALEEIVGRGGAQTAVYTASQLPQINQLPSDQRNKAIAETVGYGMAFSLLSIPGIVDPSVKSAAARERIIGDAMVNLGQEFMTEPKLGAESTPANPDPVTQNEAENTVANVPTKTQPPSPSVVPPAPSSDVSASGGATGLGEAPPQIVGAKTQTQPTGNGIPPQPQAASSEIAQMMSARGATDVLYQKIFDAAQAGRKTVSGVTEPLIAEAAPLISSGKIKSPQELKAWVQDGKPTLNSPQIDAEAQRQAARAETDTSPTPAQVEAGNYAKGKVNWNGLTIAIENPAGSTRSGQDAAGKPWSVRMPADYGQILGQPAADGDLLDAYLGPNLQSGKVFVVDQKDPKTGKFDEHKTLIGFDSGEQAVRTYDAGFSDNSGASRIQAMTEMSVPEFKKWLADGDKTKPAADYAASMASRKTRPSGYSPPEEPERFDSLEEILAYRDAAREAEIDFYKSLGLSQAEAVKMFRASDARSNLDVTALEDKLTPENRERLDAFSTGEGYPIYRFDRLFDPNNIKGEKEKSTLALGIVMAASKGDFEPVFDDRTIYAVASFLELQKNRGTWSDIALALDKFTTQNSSSQEDKTEYFKTLGARIKSFAIQQGIHLNQGDLGKNHENRSLRSRTGSHQGTQRSLRATRLAPQPGTGVAPTGPTGASPQQAPPGQPAGAEVSSGAAPLGPSSTATDGGGDTEPGSAVEGPAVGQQPSQTDSGIASGEPNVVPAQSGTASELQPGGSATGGRIAGSGQPTGSANSDAGRNEAVSERGGAGVSVVKPQPLRPAIRIDKKQVHYGDAGQLHAQLRASITPAPGSKVEDGWVDADGNWMGKKAAAIAIADFYGVKHTATPKDDGAARTAQFGEERPHDIIDDFEAQVGGKISLPKARELIEDFKPKGAAKKIFSDTGIAPDKAAQALGKDSAEDFLEAINKAAAIRSNSRSGEKAKKTTLAQMEEQRIAFDHFSQKKGEDKQGLAASALLPGDTFSIEGHKFTVHEIDHDDDGEPTAFHVDDGNKFGAQSLAPEQAIQIDAGSLTQAEVPSFSLQSPAHERLILIQRPDGTNYEASFAGEYENRADRFGQPIPKIKKWNGSEWESSALKPGEYHRETISDFQGADTTLRYLPPDDARSKLARKLQSLLYPRGNNVLAAVADPLGTDTWENVEKAFGKRIVFIKGSQTPDWGGLTHRGIPDVLFINYNNRRPYLQVIGHELIESFKHDQPEFFEELRNELEPLMRNFPEYRARLEQNYTAAGRTPPSEPDIKADLIADFVGDQFREEKFWEDLSAINPSLFQRLATAAIDFLRKLIVKLYKFGAGKYFTEPEKAQRIVVDALSRFKAAAGEAKGSGTSLSLQGPELEGVPHRILGHDTTIGGKPSLDEAAATASLQHAGDTFRAAGIPVSLVTETDPRRANYNSQWWQIQDDGFDKHAEGKALLDAVKKSLATENQPGKPLGHVSDLVNSLTINFQRGLMNQFDPSTRDQLFALVRGYASRIGAELGALGRNSVALEDVGNNPELFLTRTYSDAFGGDAYESIVRRAAEQFRSYFTPAEIADAFKSAPDAERFINQLLALSQRDQSGRVYRSVQQYLKPKRPVTLNQMESKAKTNEAIEAILAHARKLGIEEPKQVGKTKLAPDERLGLMARPETEAKLQEAIEAAVHEAEVNAGIAAWRKSLAGNPDAVADADARISAGEEPAPEYVEQGLSLPEFAHWRPIRDNFLSYSPTTLKLVRDVINGRFKGTRFTPRNPAAPDSRIDLAELAKNPDKEVQRVTDAQMAEVERILDINRASDATRAHILDTVRRQIADQIERIRASTRDTALAAAKTPPQKQTPEQKLAVLINSKLFADPRLDVPETVDRLASKGVIKNLIPTAPKITKEILDAAATSQTELRQNFLDRLVKGFGLPDTEAAKAWTVFAKAFDTKLSKARATAADAALKSLTPEEKKVVTKKSQIDVIRRNVNTGNFDTPTILRDVAKKNGWSIPSAAEIARLKDLTLREQTMRDLTPTQRAKILDDPDMTDAEKQQEIAAQQSDREAATALARAKLLREIDTLWAQMAKPTGWAGFMGFGRGDLRPGQASPAENRARMMVEYGTMNILAKVGYIPRLAIHMLPVQSAIHLATNTLAKAFEEISAARASGAPTQADKRLASAVSDSFRSLLASVKPTLLAARAELFGRGLGRNVGELNEGMQTFERMNAKADALAKSGKHVQALFTHIAAFPGLLRYYVNALDQIQGTPAEYQETINQVDTAMREMGRTPAEIAMFKDTLLKSMTSEMVRATNDAANILAEAETPGIHGPWKPDAQIKEAAAQLLKARTYAQLATLGLPADDFAARNEDLRKTLAWQKPVEHGLGAYVTLNAKAARNALAKYGIPFLPANLSNAMGTGINYALMFAPSIPGTRIGLNRLAFFPVGKDAPPVSPWEASERQRRQAAIMSLLGTLIGGALMAAIFSGKARVVTSYPKKKEDRDKFIAEGHHVGTLEWVHDDGKFSAYSLTVGWLNPLRGHIYAAQAIQELSNAAAAAQKKADAAAAKHGVTAQKIPAPSALQMTRAALIGFFNGILQGSSTVQGAIQSMTEKGEASGKKLVASLLSEILPGVPAYQELSRAGGVSLDPKKASILDYLIPLPTSGAREVNMLGDPVRTPDDIQRIVQTFTSGTYPLDIDPKADADARVYQAIEESGFRPPAINQGKGYEIGGQFRPLTSDELERYTVARGEILKNDLINAPVESKSQIEAVFAAADRQALQSVGATPTGQKTVEQASNTLTASKIRPVAASPAGRQQAAGVAAGQNSGKTAPRASHATFGRGFGGSGSSRGPGSFGNQTSSGSGSHIRSGTGSRSLRGSGHDGRTGGTGLRLRSISAPHQRPLGSLRSPHIGKTRSLRLR